MPGVIALSNTKAQPKGTVIFISAPNEKVAKSLSVTVKLDFPKTKRGFVN